MRRFAFVVHPLRFDDFARKFPFVRHLPPGPVEAAFRLVPPMKTAHVTGVVSQSTGETLEGWLIGLPMTPRGILESPYPVVLRKLLQAGRMAEALGAEILGLGAFTKIAGDRGVTLAERLAIPVTTGNSYTTATAVEGALRAAGEVGIEPGTAAVAVIGATGSIGAACCHLLARRVPALTVTARRRERLEALAEDLRSRYRVAVRVETDIPRAVRGADIVIAVSSSPDALVAPEDLKPGAVVCDVARPRNLSRVVTERRPDVLVIDGGVIEVPGEQADMGMDFGFPPRMVEACMAETMALALEGRLENFTLGPTVDPAKAEEIHAIAARHGFRQAGFRRFERAIPASDLDPVRAARAAARVEQAAGAPEA
jgi:fatty aldehyde-generating acyl-ACP reductase